MDTALPRPLGLRISSSSSSSSERECKLDSDILETERFASCRAGGRFLRAEKIFETRRMSSPAVDGVVRCRGMFSMAPIFERDIAGIVGRGLCRQSGSMGGGEGREEVMFLSAWRQRVLATRRHSRFTSRRWEHHSAPLIISFSTRHPSIPFLHPSRPHAVFCVQVRPPMIHTLGLF